MKTFVTAVLQGRGAPVMTMVYSMLKGKEVGVVVERADICCWGSRRKTLVGPK